MADILALKKEYCPASELSAQEKAFCEGYVDQCVAQSSQKSQGESTYEVVSDSGTRVGDMDYLGCLGFSAFAGVSYGKAKGVTGEVAAQVQPSDMHKPNVEKNPNGVPVENVPAKVEQPLVEDNSEATVPAKPVQTSPVVIIRHFNHFRQMGSDGIPNYIFTDAIEHARFCVDKEEASSYSAQERYKFLEFKALVNIESKLCGENNYYRSPPYIKENLNKHLYKRSLEGIEWKREGTVCWSAYYIWTKIECVDGTVYESRDISN